MVLTFEQTRELEMLKHEQKKELMGLDESISIQEHKRKMQRLQLQLEMAKVTGAAVSKVKDDI